MPSKIFDRAMLNTKKTLEKRESACEVFIKN